MFKYSRDIDAIREQLSALEHRITALTVNQDHAAKNAAMLGQTMLKIYARLGPPKATDITIDRLPDHTADIAKAVVEALKAEGVKL